MVLPSKSVLALSLFFSLSFRERIYLGTVWSRGLYRWYILGNSTDNHSGNRDWQTLCNSLFNGCRVWDDYVYVERSKIVRVRTNFSDRVKYVSTDPVKKEYRTWKEKEYRYAKERRTNPAEKQIRSRSEYTRNKSSRVEGKVVPDRDRNRTEYEARKEVRERDVIRDKERNERKKLDDKKIVAKKEKSKEKKFKTERVSREKSYSKSKNLKSSSYKQKTVKVHKQTSNRTSGKSMEVKKTKNVRKR